MVGASVDVAVAVAQAMKGSAKKAAPAKKAKKK